MKPVSSFGKMVRGNGDSPQTSGINKDEVKDIADGLQGVRDVLDASRTISNYVQGSQGTRTFSDAVREVNDGIEGVERLKSNLGQGPGMSTGDQIKGIKETIQEAKGLTEELEGGSRRNHERLFNVDDEGNLWPDPNGQYNFWEALQVRRDIKAEMKEREQNNGRRMFNVDDEGNLFADPQGAFTFDEALQYSREIRRERKEMQLSQERLYNVDDDGNIFPDEKGAFNFEQARQVANDRKSEKRNSRSVYKLIDKNTGVVEDYDPDKPLVIRPTQPNQPMLRDADGNPITREQMQMQIEWDKAQDDKRRAEDEHRQKVEFLKNINANFPMLAGAIRDSIDELRNRGSSKAPANPTGSNRETVQCGKCGADNEVSRDSTEFVCDSCGEENEIQP